MNTKSKKSFYLTDMLWDLWCITSIIGVWPRFIEPNLISTSQVSIQLPNLHKDLHGLKIVQFSDLHFQPKVSDNFLKRLTKKIHRLKPDIIVFTGDFLCYSVLSEKERLLEFLNSLHAPYGCYAVLGNHDYQNCIAINKDGEYDIFKDNQSIIKRGIQRLFTETKLAKKTTPAAKATGFHDELMSLLQKSSFSILNNETKLLKIKNSYLNICGLGEYVLGKTDSEKTFRHYDQRYPGVTLLHNPDAIPLLDGYPGEVILSGHTHGGQINLPWIWKKFTLMENPNFKKGLIRHANKWVYVNRGIGGVMTFRWFAKPEVLLLTLENQP